MQHVNTIEFTNHLMFNAVLTENEDLCARLIGAVLGKHVERVEFIDDEAVIPPTIDARGARLDVLALIDGEYVDIEMQVGHEPEVARRCRFYHSAIATRYAPKGAGYSAIPQSYVIFICLSDPLGAGLARYELATACRNDASVHVEDGAVTILLNASAWEREENPEVAGMLNYALTGHYDDGLARDLARAVEDKNLDRKWVRASMGVMTYEHEFAVLNHAIEEKKAEVAEAQAKLEAVQADLDAKQAEVDAKQAEVDAIRSDLDVKQAIQNLAKLLHAEGRIDEYIAALDDAQLMDKLLKEFGLKG